MRHLFLAAGILALPVQAQAQAQPWAGSWMDDWVLRNPEILARVKRDP